MKERGREGMKDGGKESGKEVLMIHLHRQLLFNQLIN